jgi:Cytochrome P460
MRRTRSWRLAVVMLGSALLWTVAGSLGPAQRPLLAAGAKWWLPPSKEEEPAEKPAEKPEPAKTEPAPAAQEAPAAPATQQPPAEAPKAATQQGPAPAPVPAAASAPAAPAAPALAAAVAMPAPGDLIDWGTDYHTWDVATGYLISASHGDRLLRIYIQPHAAALVYRHNTELVLLRKIEGFLPYPEGTQVAAESWQRTDKNGPGQAEAVFFMRKQPAGYDPAGGDWEYGMTHPDLTLFGEGHDGKMQFCKDCHANAKAHDYVFPVDR